MMSPRKAIARGAMKWIDHPNYFGPDRRTGRLGMRLLERRRDDFSCEPPPLATAMRQLRQHILDAHGERIDAFVIRVESTALLARMNGEPSVSAALLRLGAVARLGRERDVRPDLIEMLNQAHTAMRRPVAEQTTAALR